MFYKLKELQGYKIRASDGELGSVHEVYFDEHEWRVRYFVVDTGTLLPGRKVLIAPESVSGIDTDEQAVVVKLTREHVKNSPDINTDTPVTREHETALSKYYGWNQYWIAGYPMRPGMSATFGTPYGVVSMPAPEGPHNTEEEELEAIENQDRESTLCSSRDVAGYHIAATDGEIGHVDDYIIDAANWDIRYLVVETGGWLNERKVLLAPEWIESVDWHESRVYANLTRDAISNSPKYDPDIPLTREYESQLFDSYHRPRYWEPPQDKSRRQREQQR